MVVLEEKIKEEIRKNGSISFERFMEMALYFQDYGYYMRKETNWGKEGDYYTCAHLHGIFGAIIAEQIKEFWHFMGEPEEFFVVEGGAGTGDLAESILSYLRRYRRDFFERLSYAIIEMNPYLRSSQMKRLQCFNSVLWFKEIEGVFPFSGIFISNELFDAFPVRIVEMDEELKEVFVGLVNGRFVEIKTKAGEDLRSYFDAFSIPLKKGQRTEVNLKLRDFINKLSQKMKNGFLFTIDYGLSAKEYFSHERSRGTLMCYFKHRFHDDPYTNIGEQDITSHINFSALKKWGEEVGFRVVGYTTLGLYLLSSGVLDLWKRIYTDNDLEYLKLKTLLFPEGFGESHRVMVQYKGEGTPKIRGFSLKDMKTSL